MKSRFLIAAVASVLLLTTGMSGRQEGSKALDTSHGNGLLEACTSERKFTNDLAFSNYVYCMGYIDGLADGLELGKFVDRPAGVTNVQTKAVVVKYLQDHPESLHLSSVILVSRALINAWPGKKVPQ